jgi:rod shape-determining protein MreC
VAILDIRQRAGYLFIGVTLAQIILISAQVQSKSGVPVLEAVTFGLFAEVQRAGSSAVSSVQRNGGGFVDLRGVSEENERLKKELAATQIRVQQQRALADRARGLEELLKLSENLELETMAARVIAGAAEQNFRTLTIDKGNLDGIRADMAVIAPAGVVGRVIIPSARAAKVQLLIDGNAGAGALIERSRAQAVAVGMGDRFLRLGDDRVRLQDDRLRLQYVPDSSDIAKGDAVVTSGIEGIFPKGFLIGHVDDVQKAGAGYKQITVRPAVDFTRLEEVLVVVTLPPARQLNEESTR